MSKISTDQIDLLVPMNTINPMMKELKTFKYNDSLLNDLPDFTVLEILRKTPTPQLLNLCLVNKRMRRLCGFKIENDNNRNNDGNEGIYDLNLKERIMKLIQSLEKHEIFPHKIGNYYIVTSKNAEEIDWFMNHIRMYNPHAYFIKEVGNELKIASMMMHTNAGIFFTGYVPEIGDIYGSQFGSDNEEPELRMIQYILNNGFEGVIGFIDITVDDTKVIFISSTQDGNSYTKFKNVISKSKIIEI